MRVEPFFIGIQSQRIDSFKSDSGVVDIDDPLLLQIFL